MLGSHQFQTQLGRRDGVGSGTSDFVSRKTTQPKYGLHYANAFCFFLQHRCSTLIVFKSKGFPGGSEGKASACNVGDLGLIPGLGRNPGKGNGNPLQYSCLENSMGGGTW